MGVNFVFETLPPEEDFDPSTRSFRVRNSSCVGGQGRYYWLGITRHRCSALQVGHVADFSLRAVFTSTGIYNLNRFRFNLEVEGAPPRVFFFPLQHLIHVSAHSESQPESSPPLAETESVLQDN
eukprot:TRINITY_DN10259_c0_g2_i4.p1 TRINITY_DN10259_c0_g2~~TRINITY_DN10259_c0_g2_i4.p1  ORF type:complete len:134 (-),score=36.11 TRINITY_DN10259_c0_g2_i4:33-404(-)